MPVYRNCVSRLLKAGAMALAMFGAVAGGETIFPSGLLITGAQAQAVHTRSIRLGLHKSAVVRLPAGVKDILVGNDEIAEVVLRSRRTMYLFARKLGGTNIFLLNDSGQPMMQLQLVVVLNPDGLQKLLKKAVPGADIRVEPMENQILLTGSAKTPAEANKAVQIAKNYVKSIGTKMLASGGDGNSEGMQVVNAIRITGKDQVMIKVKLAEVQRDIFKQLRTNFSQFNFSTGDLAGAFAMVFPFSLGNRLADAAFTSGTLTYNGRRIQSQTFLQALERDGLMRLLAEPTLTAISGESAKFLAGGEVPIIAGYDPTTGNYTYKMKEIGVILGFSPVVLTESRISLKVNVEVSEISGKYALPIAPNVTVPGFEKRQAATTVELPSGGTLAIAGMFREQTKKNIDGVPGLKNVPILGALFRSRDFQSNQSELVVLATPYIVTPRNEKKFRTPVDRLNIASDLQNYFLGRLNRVYGAPSGPKGDGMVYHGDVGFIVE